MLLTVKQLLRLVSDLQNILIEKGTLSPIQTEIYWRGYNAVKHRINSNKTNRSDHLYLFYSPKYKLYKIGISYDPHKRLVAVKREINDNDIEILKIMPNKGYLEKSLHNKFNDINVPLKGLFSVHKEWFKKSEKIINEFNKLEINEK